MIRILLLIIAFLSGLLAIAQTTESLKESKHLYIHGNSILIGNNILGHHITKPMTDDNIPNDAVKMKYIDVDQDKNTFSSSRAAITGAPENSRIAYAALYWSALYPYKKSIIRTRNNEAHFIGKGEREPDINHVLFQIPGMDYISIEGEILKDEHNNNAFSNVSPYVCRADVTGLLQELEDLNGIYTVANVKATEGNISGGGSAGWVLYIVYEDFNESLKYFTTYDGLIQVNRETVDVKFSGFKSNQKGKINSTLGIAALEGDRKIPTDQMLVYSPKTDEFIAMSNSLRSERNFFNSSITMGNQIYNNRNPNSSNTLGFDLLKLDIPNADNEFFDVNTTETTLRFQTKADRFFLFFISFEIGMDRDYLENLNSELIASDKKAHQTKLLSKNILDPKKLKNSPSEKPEWNQLETHVDENSDSVNTIPADGNKVEDSDKPSQDKKEIRYQAPLPADGELSTKKGIRKARYPNLSEAEKIRLKEEIETQESIQIQGIPAGYYLVTNVFSIPENAKHWREFLIRKAFTPSSFVNPENNWEYVYIDSFTNLDDGFDAWLNLQDKGYFIGLWLMKVNWHTDETSSARF